MHFGASREAQIPAILDMMRLPYTGSGVIGMAITQHKVMTKKILACAGISTPRYVYLTNPQVDTHNNLRFPLIVKPAHQGSSIGINMFSRVENTKELKRQIQWLWNKFHEPILVEEFIEGRDMNLGFLADQPLAFVENIIPIGYNSYEFKGEKLSQVQKLCPVEIPESVADEIISAGRTAITALEVYDWCRMDFRIDKENQHYLIEVNAISTLSEKGVFARGAYETGYESYKEIIEKILLSAMARYGMHL
jgi:D-alanine-D-alanine ligase